MGKKIQIISVVFMKHVSGMTSDEVKRRVYVTKSDIPKTAKVVDVQITRDGEEIQLHWEDESFPEIPGDDLYLDGPTFSTELVDPPLPSRRSSNWPPTCANKKEGAS